MTRRANRTPRLRPPQLHGPRSATRDGNPRIARALAMGLACLFAGCVTSPDARIAKADRQSQRAAAALARRDDADSLAAAGLLLTSIHRDESLVLIARAAAAAPERADLAFLHAQVCYETPPCDPEPLERRLRELDPSNGAGWMGALARADKSKNDAAKHAALAAIGRSERFDIYWTALITRLVRATSMTKTMPQSEAEILIIGILAAQAIPAYGVVGNACKGDRLQRADIIEVCRGVARALESGDTYLTEMIGVAIAKRVWPEDSPEWKAAAEARRVYDYRSKLLTSVDWSDKAHDERYLALCAQNRREQDVFLAQLIEEGKNPNPPPE